MSFETKRDVVRAIFLLVPTAMLFYLLNQWVNTPVVHEFTAKAEEVVVEATPSATPTPEPVAVDMEEKIREVFTGEHGDKAMILLKGKDGQGCAENRALNPEAVNWNGNGTSDFGLFQINDHWHGFNKAVNNDRYLLDPDINIRIAWRIYEDNDYSFKLWTCGKAWGI